MSFRRLAIVPVLLAALFAATATADERPGRQSLGTGGPRHRASVDRGLELAARHQSSPRVIVRYRSGTENEVRARLVAKGARSLRNHDGIGALSLELPAGQIDSTAVDPDILSLSLDAVVMPDQTASVAQDFGSLTSTVDAQALRRTLGVPANQTGADVGVAIIDSGIRPSLDLLGRISAFYDFTRGGTQTYPSDGYGHGTHIAGLITGSGLLSSGRYVGVASNVRLIGLKVLDDNGCGYTSNVIAAIDFAIANKARLRIDVINLSLGHPVYESPATDPLVLAVERAVAARIVVVVSAGNAGMNPVTGQIGYGGISSPGNAQGALTVGSLRTKGTASRFDDEVSPFSSRGPTWYEGLMKPDVLAPGQGIVAVNSIFTQLYRQALLRADVIPYLRLSGTSMATGITSGVVALMIEEHRRDQPTAPPLTPNLVKAILQYTAIPVVDPDPSTPAAFEQGAGGVNAAGALALVRAIDTTMPLGTSWIEYGVQPFSLLGDQIAAWAQHIVWGDHLVWGDTVTWNLLAWSSHIVWGGSDEHVVWGESTFTFSPNIVLDSFSAWATHIVWGDLVRLVQTADDAHIVWGELDDWHVVWGDRKDGSPSPVPDAY